MKNCPLIDLEVDSVTEQAETVGPSLLHQDLEALGAGSAGGGRHDVGWVRRGQGAMRAQCAWLLRCAHSFQS